MSLHYQIAAANILFFNGKNPKHNNLDQHLNLMTPAGEEGNEVQHLIENETEQISRLCA